MTTTYNVAGSSPLDLPSPGPPARSRAERGPSAEAWRRRHREASRLWAQACRARKTSPRGGGASPGMGQGTGRRQPGPERFPYPRLGPFGTNQGPARPMRPQNVVKMMTGRAKECAVIVGAGCPGWDTGRRDRRCGCAGPGLGSGQQAAGSEHAQRDPRGSRLPSGHDPRTRISESGLVGTQAYTVTQRQRAVLPRTSFVNWLNGSGI